MQLEDTNKSEIEYKDNYSRIGAYGSAEILDDIGSTETSNKYYYVFLLSVAVEKVVKVSAAVVARCVMVSMFPHLLIIIVITSFFIIYYYCLDVLALK